MSVISGFCFPFTDHIYYQGAGEEEGEKKMKRRWQRFFFFFTDCSSFVGLFFRLAIWRQEEKVLLIVVISC